MQTDVLLEETDDASGVEVHVHVVEPRTSGQARDGHDVTADCCKIVTSSITTCIIIITTYHHRKMGYRDHHSKRQYLRYMYPAPTAALTSRTRTVKPVGTPLAAASVLSEY